jgi:hypothetical protein
MRWVVSVKPCPRFSPGEMTPGPTVQEAGWAPEPVWTKSLQENPIASVGHQTSIVRSSSPWPDTILTELPDSQPTSRTLKYDVTCFPSQVAAFCYCVYAKKSHLLQPTGKIGTQPQHHGNTYILTLFRLVKRLGMRRMDGVWFPAMEWISFIATASRPTLGPFLGLRRPQHCLDLSAPRSVKIKHKCMDECDCLLGCSLVEI